MEKTLQCTKCAKVFAVEQSAQLSEVNCPQCGTPAIPGLAAIWDMVWSSSSVSEDGLVPPVDPSDMKALLRTGREWPMGRERHMAQAVGSTARGPVAAAFGSVCSPDADVTAVWYRVVMLGMCDEAGLLSAHKHDGDFTDAVFNIAAKFPMKRVEADAEYQGPPFDTEEFIKQVERASAE